MSVSENAKLRNNDNHVQNNTKQIQQPNITYMFRVLTIIKLTHANIPIVQTKYGQPFLSVFIRISQQPFRH
ncbi:MAG: hypothetical protein ACRD9Q_11180, partial [Nitrososphaeraceae archaeon]